MFVSSRSRSPSWRLFHFPPTRPLQFLLLGFAWKFPKEASIRYFVFSVLPFGLSSAPYIFTKCLKPLEKYWRFNGVNIALFLDDGWLIDSDRDTCTTLAASIWSDLRKAGFITNDEKSQWCPSQVCEWLGIIWNTISGTIALSERRENSIAIAIDRILSSDRSVSARVLASLLGRIIPGGAVFGNISRLMTRYCSISVASAQNWDSKFYLDQYCIRELNFWKSNLKRLNCRVVIDSLALHSFLPLLVGSYTKWFSDSQTACKIIQVGSMRSELHTIAVEIFQFCANNDIELELQWIPRTEIERADYISRIIDIDDWQISADCFKSLEECWGVHSVDCFANYYNKKVCKFSLDFGIQVVVG